MLVDVISLHENLTVAASPELKDAVRAAAAAQRQTMADYVRLATVAALARDGRSFPRMRDHAHLGLTAPRRPPAHLTRN
ncbi:hypothetical protein [Lichenifustis flavocetrariae]|uniref:DUF1778 domain-containing protein n=1 Tax=Lichenifustis flavocetrariae TaxID=2949735 RepID=A0AA41YQX1_9HYPH|nr:hypothetical protein [Lichenifustis flavocetrariae]MCW6506899.1 hypothetical protein [Lichenifustis flavocetrariae]